MSAVNVIIASEASDLTKTRIETIFSVVTNSNWHAMLLIFQLSQLLIELESLSKTKRILMVYLYGVQ